MTKDRWMDSVPEIGTCRAEVHARAALGRLYTALTFVDNESRLEKAQYAAAHIVAWRKSLGVESRRIEYQGSLPWDSGLLWRAVQQVSAAVEPDDDTAAKAARLRYAEAFLRAHWEENK